MGRRINMGLKSGVKNKIKTATVRKTLGKQLTRLGKKPMEQMDFVGRK